jgi:glycosyltransferase involved in cell wall biosynthesis
VDRPLRILEVFEPPDGGVPEHVRLLAAGLARRGHTVVAAGRPEAAPRAYLEAHGVGFAELPSFVGTMIDPRRDARTLGTLVRLIRAGRFDVVSTHGQKAGLLGRLAGPLLRVPVTYTPHSLIYRHQFVLGEDPAARRRYRRTLRQERFQGRFTRLLIGVSEEEAAAAVADGLVAAERAVAIHNGVEVDTTVAPDPELLAFREDGPLFGFVAGLRDQKGLPTLLDALDLLAARGALPRFAIVGNGPMESFVRDRIAAGALADRVRLFGYGGRVEPYLAALDAFVLPSYWEGLPLAVLEAMFFGLPVVASAAGGTPEAVADGETGWIVPVADASTLADRIAALADAGPESRATMGRAGASRAAAEFGVERMVDATEAALVSVAGG